jgi:hypothetical protein
MKKGIPFFLFFLLISTSYATKPKNPIVIKPVVTQFDSIPKFNEGIKLYTQSFTDTTPSKESGQLGTTRTGIKKTSPIIIKPSLVESFKTSFQSLLEARGNYSADISVATYTIDIKIIECTITEKSAGLSQTMTATMKVEVRIAPPLDNSKARIFTVEGQNATTSMDTSKFAERIMRDTFTNLFIEIIKVINKS